MGRYEEAIASYETAILIRPEAHEAWFNRGVSLGKQGRYEEAVESYDKALEIQPEDQEALENRKLSLKHL